MLPANTVFPEFVPDQLLTSDNLNQLFGYLNEQGRMTRTNLIGIGIVCGLEVHTNATGTAITITKGCGVTSEGYLVTVPTITYTEFNTFDALKERFYDRFVDIGTTTQKFNLWELKQAAVDPDATDLTAGFLSDKVVLIFVELLEEDNKNCDPDSCDDKGINVTVTFRPLLVTKANAESLKGANMGTVGPGIFTGLPELRMPRFDVPNTLPVTSQNVFDAYKIVLNNAFMVNVENTLAQSYTALFAFVGTEFPANPFSGLAAGLSFINNGSATLNQLIHIQYYYDLFSDLLLAYEELRKTGTHILTACCPDSNLFPRHLLLGEAIPLPSTVKSLYRHYFIYSPLFEHRNLLHNLKSLFVRLVLLRNRFFLPPVNSSPSTAAIDPFIKITPSKLGDVPLSKKAIPYYYNVTAGTPPFYQTWDFEKTAEGVANHNLSYHSNLYNATDDFVINPLHYDLEPYNFLRIEGIVGKPYVSVLRNLKRLILQKRLPFAVIALSTDDYRFYKDFVTNRLSVDLLRTAENADLLKMLCHFQDLEALYETMKNEMLCMLCKELKYYYDFKLNFIKRDPNTGAQASGTPSIVPLFAHCSPGYLVMPGTFGFIIEKVYSVVGDEEEITIQTIAEAFGLEELLGVDSDGDGIPDNLSSAAAIWLGYVVTLVEIPIYIIRLSQTFTPDLDSFDVDEYCRLHKILAQKAGNIKFGFNTFTATEKQAVKTEAFNRMNLYNTGTATNFAGSDTSFVAGNTNIAGAGMPANVSASLVSSNNLLANILLLFFLLEDFFDHLDVLIYNCKCSAFKALKKEYAKRVNYLTYLRLFGWFTKIHPGIQHKAGVSMGGTFIIVYHKTRRQIRGGFVRGKFALRGIVADEENMPVIGAIVKVQDPCATKGSKSVATNSKGQFTVNVLALPVVLEIIYPGFDVKEITVMSDDPITIVLGGDTPGGGNVIDTIPEGTVIADFYLPYLCCSECPPVQYIVNETPPSNIPPVARPGSDITITLPVNTVTLDGTSSSDPDGTIDKYEWTKISGPEKFTIVSASAAKTDVTDLELGSYEFQLKVTDNQGASHTDTVKITVVNRPTKPPVANAGPDITITLPVSTATLDGSASSDPSSVIVSYEWTKLAGPTQFNLSTPSSAKTDATSLVEGLYEFQLKVTNNHGDFDTDTARITVLPPTNELPVADAGKDMSITLPVNIATLDGSKSFDPDGNIVGQTWRQIAGPALALISAPDALKTQVGNLQIGIYEFELKVADNRGETDTDTVRVIVNENRPPIVDAGPDRTTTLPENSVTLTGSGSDPDGPTPQFSWRLSSPPLAGVAPPIIGSPNTAQTSVNNLTPGTFEFELTATDNKGLTATDTVKVTVNRAPTPNRPPVANAGLNAAAFNGEFFPLDGSASSDPEGNITEFAWKSLHEGPNPPDLEDGNKVIARAKAGEGRYAFRLTVVDAEGAKTSDTVFKWVRKDSLRPHSCLDFRTIPSMFNSLRELPNFSLFMELFALYPDVERFFTELEPLNTLQQDKHADFFANLTTHLSREWFDKLVAIILSTNAQHVKVRMAAIRLYRTLVAVMMYMCCVRKEDINNATLPIDLTKFTPEFVKSLSAQERKEFAELQKQFEEEFKRLHDSPDPESKPIYFDMIADYVIYFERLQAAIS